MPHGQRKEHLHLHRMRRHQPQVAGQVPGLRGLEHPDRIGGATTAAVRNRFASLARTAEVATLADIDAVDMQRTPTGHEELDRVLGGGIVEGGVVLIGGDPGIGKSTLLLQALHALQAAASTLYVTGEESGAQVALRARRLGLDGSQVKVLAEIGLEKILATLAGGATRCGRDRFDPDRVFRPAHLSAGFGGPGARMCRASHARGQGQRRVHRAGRPCHQGRRPGRPARARAHGRHGAVFRGRHAQQLPAGACHQEPVWRGQRDRRVRDDRTRAQGREQSERDLPEPAR
jgi:energy-coupling factor transporter ATP-binding protein EcfA2